jgi:hypothetical protein
MFHISSIKVKEYSGETTSWPELLRPVSWKSSYNSVRLFMTVYDHKTVVALKARRCLHYTHPFEEPETRIINTETQFPPAVL